MLGPSRLSVLKNIRGKRSTTALELLVPVLVCKGNFVIFDKIVWFFCAVTDCRSIKD